MNPDCVFPDVVSAELDSGSPIFVARDMGHPLLPDETRVGNDFTLERLGEVVIITGSNMSGKSTFLRTVGVNLCLAFSGAPVQASAWCTRPFRLFTCMTVSDSVTDGISYFYAEVRRLKALLEALQEPHPYPLFFLIDEIFRGTNNRERHIGSRAYIQALVGGHGVGIVSTHDLELVKLDHDIGGIHNAHFREDIAEGQMVFDYTLRAGPCPTTNALHIMRRAGLPVP
jgi:DNA mismatch repair ATPase MutS